MAVIGYGEALSQTNPIFDWMFAWEKMSFFSHHHDHDQEQSSSVF